MPIIQEIVVSEVPTVINSVIFTYCPQTGGLSFSGMRNKLSNIKDNVVNKTKSIQNKMGSNKSNSSVSNSSVSNSSPKRPGIVSRVGSKMVTTGVNIGKTALNYTPQSIKDKGMQLVKKGSCSGISFIEGSVPTIIAEIIKVMTTHFRTRIFEEKSYEDKRAKKLMSIIPDSVKNNIAYTFSRVVWRFIPTLIFSIRKECSSNPKIPDESEYPYPQELIVEINKILDSDFTINTNIDELSKFEMKTKSGNNLQQKSPISLPKSNPPMNPNYKNPKDQKRRQSR
jgi:hypothetical protein